MQSLPQKTLSTCVAASFLGSDFCFCVPGWCSGTPGTHGGDGEIRRTAILLDQKNQLLFLKHTFKRLLASLSFSVKFPSDSRPVFQDILQPGPDIWQNGDATALRWSRWSGLPHYCFFSWLSYYLLRHLLFRAAPMMWHRQKRALFFFFWGVYGGGQKGSGVGSVASSLFCLPQSAFIRS